MRDAALVTAFKNSGFTEKTYEGQDGIFLLKEIPTALFIPEDKREMVGTLPEKMIVELCPDGRLQYLIDFDLGLFENFSLRDEKEKWLGLAACAGLDVDEIGNLIPA